MQKNRDGGFFTAISAPDDLSKLISRHTHVYSAIYGQIYVVDVEAWDEPIYSSATICDDCGEETPT